MNTYETAIVNEALLFAKIRLDQVQADPGHDYQHIKRVLKNAQDIIKVEEDVDQLVVEVAAITHDLIDDKVFPDVQIARENLQYFLEGSGLSARQIENIWTIIENMSFSAFKGEVFKDFKEGQIVQDADRLDAIGAIGIGRAFAYGGSKGQALFDPAIPTRQNLTKEDLRQGPTTTINHFFEKLFTLKDLMNTQKGKAIAQERHDFMLDFVNQFLAEVGD